MAQDLNISIGTVSRALNGKSDVSQETRARVMEAAAAMGYVPNQAGRSLRKGNTNAIGFIYEGEVGTTGHGDTFFLGVFSGVQDVLSRHHLDLVVLPCPRDDDPTEHVRRIMARRMVDGLIVSATRRKDSRIELLNRAGIPFVALGRSSTPGTYPWLDLDFAGVAGQATDRMVAAGHRRIAVAVPSNDVNLGFVYLEGYKQALARHGIAFDPELVLRVASSEEGGYQAGHELLSMDNRPTAVLLIYELMAIGLYRRLNEAGVRPGRDVAVVGFRESSLSRFLSPTLTSYRISLRSVGVMLAEALLASMPDYAEHYPMGLVHRVLPLELVEGESDTTFVSAAGRRERDP
nr:substrate-binding domain-containing protein [Devosia oryzisoli]